MRISFIHFPNSRMGKHMEMESLEFWIWEHAKKHGMPKVLKRMKTTFPETSLPNSWLGALFLRQIKDDWDKTDNKITPNDLSSVWSILTSTFKQHKKEMKNIIRKTNVIQLDLCCKAAFLVMRSTGCSLAVKKQSRDQLFPIWNTSLWIKIKGSFGLKDDLLLDEIQKYYSEIRLQLCQGNQTQAILDMFGAMMKRHFPSFIAFMQRLKLSMLERIQMKKKELGPQLNFVLVRLNDGPLSEIVILNILEDMQRKKIKERVLKFLKQKESFAESRINTDDDFVTCEMFTLPPSNSKSEICEGEIPFYPPCFMTNPFMPSCIFLDDQLQARLIDKSIPRNMEGIPFEPHWFSDANSLNLKKEKEEFSKCDRIHVTSHKVSSVENETALSHGHDKFESEELAANDDERTKKEYLTDQLGLPITQFPPGRIQSWIDDQNPSASPSESSSSSCVPDLQLVSSSKIVNCFPSKKIADEQRFVKGVEIESIKSTDNEPSLTKGKNFKRKQSGSKLLLQYEKDPLSYEAESNLSVKTRVEETDVDAVSSTTVSSNTRIKSSLTPWNYLKAARMKTANKCDAPNKDEESSESEEGIRFRNQALKMNQVKSMKVRASSRLKKKSNQISSSSENLSTASSFGSHTKKKNMKAIVLTESDSESSCDNVQPASNRLDGTPPIEEPSSNYQTPIQKERNNLSVNELETSFHRTAIKRKLSMDEDFDSPKNKRVPLERLTNRCQNLPNVLELLKKHSNKLHMKGHFAAKHREELERCIEDVFYSHQRVNQNLTDDQLDTEIAATHK